MIEGPRMVDPLIAALVAPDPNVRGYAAEALGRIKDPRSVEPLIAALKDSDSSVRVRAIEALGRFKDPRSVEPLIAALKDPEGNVRSHAARGLEYLEDPRQVNALLARLRAHDLEVAAGAYAFFLNRGVRGSEDTMIQALNALGTAGMAEAFANSHNPKLTGPGFEWARAHGYVLIPRPR
jgi:HEAT repeat protein